MAHEMLWGGLLLLGIALAIFLILYFLLKPFVGRLEGVQRWYLVGTLISAFFGFFIGRIFSMWICWGTGFGIFCSIPIHLLGIVGTLLLLWRLLVYRGKEL